MPVQLIEKGVYFVGVRDWDRKLFDELIPLPQGTSYNSYVVEGNEKTALIDTVDPTKTNELLNNLDELGLNIDYIISNHAEQDHSGSIPFILEKFPNAIIITNNQCKELLKSFLLIPEDQFKVIKDHETLSLGDKTLEFIFTPWVHWPDTMVTYLQEEKILFSCDFFGSHQATSELFLCDSDETSLIPAKRYYAELMMPFRPMVQNNLKKIKEIDIKTIAPSHGPLISKPQSIIGAYTNWVDDESLKQVVLLYVSMHGSTNIMAEHLIGALIKRDIMVKPFNLTEVDMGELVMALVDASTLVLASPTVLTRPHPLMAQTAYLVNTLRPKTKTAAIIGSYGWGTRMEEEIKELLGNLNLEYFDSIIIKGLPTEENFLELNKLADQILEAFKSSK